MNTQARYRMLETSTGSFAIIQHDDDSLETMWVNDAQSRRRLRQWTESPRLLPQLASRLAAYFDGDDVSFDDVPLPAGPSFMRRCWAACRAVPRGRTISYAQLALAAGGTPQAARAAGQAMRRNPQPIITPCHRVIGSSGLLHGFAGCMDDAGRALAIKRTLLEVEGAMVSAEAS